MITTASALPILPKDPIFHIMNMSGRNYHRRTSSCFPYNHMTMTANPSTENVPLKCRELQELKQFTVGQVFFFSFPLVPAVCYHPRVNFFIHNSYFPTSSVSRWLLKLALHSCGGDFLYFNLFRVNDDTVSQ